MIDATWICDPLLVSVSVSYKTPVMNAMNTFSA
jgi:hypothetical protein